MVGSLEQKKGPNGLVTAWAKRSAGVTLAAIFPPAVATAPRCCVWSRWLPVSFPLLE